MADPDTPTLTQEFAAALAWWRDAGVDRDFADDATDWLAQTEQKPPEQAPTPKPKPAEPVRRTAAERFRAENSQMPLVGPSEELPASLEAFAKWWQQDEALASIAGEIRVPPRGPQGADLMILVPEPEAGDTDMLMSGDEGRLLQAMLSAMQVDPDKVYFASAIPAPQPLADWPKLADAGLDRVTLHHIVLAAPKRLLVLGSGILPLLKHDTAQDAANFDKINHQGITVPVLAARTLANLRNLPGERKRFWRRWLQWTEG